MHFLVPVLLMMAANEERPPLMLREDFRETPAATPITQEHLANSSLVLGLYGPGKAGIKKSHHDRPADDPYYVWSGTAQGNWVVTLRHKEFDADLRGLAKIRWRTKQAGFRYLRIVLRLASGEWLVSDAAEGPAFDWHEAEYPIAGIRWRKLNVETVTEGRWAENPDLSRVEEIGFTDLMTGGNSDACSRVDWIEVYGRQVVRGKAGRP